MNSLATTIRFLIVRDSKVSSVVSSDQSSGFRGGQRMIALSQQFCALLAAATFATSAMAFKYSDAQSEAMLACKNAVERELGLTNYGHIDREIGMNKLGRDVYEFYLNVKTRQDKTSEAQSMKAYCQSAGFAKVRALRLSDGAWVYKTDADNQAADTRVTSER